MKKFEEKLPISTEKKHRNLIAIDETAVKANKKHYYVYSAVDVERNELILMRVYSARNFLTARSFVKEVLNYCEGKPRFVIDRAPWLRRAIKSLGLEFEHEKFRERVEAVFSSLKQRVKLFFCSITARELESVLQAVHVLLQPSEVVKLTGFSPTDVKFLYSSFLNIL